MAENPSTREPLRVAIVGTAARSDYLYGPILRALTSDVALVAVWGRSVESARRLGESLDVPWYTDLGTPKYYVVPQGSILPAV